MDPLLERIYSLTETDCEACAEHLMVGGGTRGGPTLLRGKGVRVYDPDGHTVSSHPKIHSCETEFWHGYRLQEFDVYGVPVCMHICHDGRYPGVWTLPVMFGARLILHPSNGGQVTGSIDQVAG